ncbi:hypothetical protein ACTWPT_48210 [Nonomuraea sp. 3N208]|uniref:hypothetical protein n=1 Tax=Nonomuraea sp. 3N208 TaxID=3457421 RepID=UPI003FCF0E05
MSHKRSGLLPGLAVGLVAALICAAGLGAAVLFQTRLPYAVTTFGNGHPLSVALSFLIALLITLAIGAVRPRSVILIPVGALYAGAAVAAGQIAGLSVMAGAAMHGKDTPAELSDITLTNASDGLSHAFSLYGGPLTNTWPVWLYIAVAALSALLLLALRVSRIRRTQRAEEPEQQEEPEYRAPFEPAQTPAKEQPAGDLFTPRKPARD